MKIKSYNNLSSIWKSSKLKFVSSSFCSNLSEDFLLEDSQYPVYGASGIVGFLPYFQVNKNYLGIIKDGAGIGRIQIYPSNTSLLDTMAYILPDTTTNIDWMKYVIVAMDLGKTIDKTTIPHIYYSDYGNCVIPYPPLSKQIEIADYLNKKCGLVDDVIFNLTNKIETLDRYKKSLIKEKVTTGLNNNDFVDSGTPWIGKIPRKWDIVKIGDIYQERNQQASARIHKPLSVTKMGILPQLENVAKTNDLDNRKLVLVNDFVINSRSDRKNSCGISQYEGSVSLINTVLEPIFLSNKMNNEYYNYVFHTVEFADEFYRWGHGIVDDLWTTRWREMKKIKLPFPPLSEQIEIADYLDKRCKLIDDIKSDIKKEIETLKEYKQSLIFECVTGKKVVSDE